MKKFSGPRKKKRFPLLILVPLLAVLCIGGTELLVCSYQDPALYARITAPVRAGIQRAAEAGQSAWDCVSHAAGELSREAGELSRGAVEAAGRAAANIREFFQPPAEPEVDLQLVDETQVAPPPRPQAVYAVTALEIRDGREYLTGGTQEFVYYNQTDEAWADKKYGSDRLGGYGCGPAAMAMVVSSLTDSDMDPEQMAQHCVDQGYWAKKHGSYLSIVPGVSEDFGLTCTPLVPEETDGALLSQHLLSGSLIVALMGPGHFTNGGHFIVLHGATLDGSVLVADPADRDRSLTTWDPELILEELSASRSNGSPLWVISSSSL